jgi:NAD(P)-dependent dehydrogenase (short-subunit alcohol dehydrogenase family)
VIDLPRTPSFRLDGRRALVAGASSGLGLGAAAALAEAGAELVMVGRRQAELEAAAEAVRAVGCTAEALVLDVADIAATAQAVAARGPFDVLVNSAGMARHGSCLETAADDYDSVMAVNLRGAYFLAQAVARGLVAAGRAGSIITMSSQMGVVGGPERAVYCATKHGIEGFTKAMAIELGPHGIRVNTLCPTFIRTPLAGQTLARPDMEAWVRSKIKLSRLGEVPDIMGAVLFLASDAGALVTGTSLLVDGGWTAG